MYSILFKNENLKLNDKAPDYFINLKLDQIAGAIYQSVEDKYLLPIFYTPLKNNEDIIYRQDIFKDFSNKEFFTQFKFFILHLLSTYKLYDENKHKKDSWVFKSQRLKIMDDYRNTVLSLSKYLNESQIKSEGLNSLKDYLNEFTKSDSFVNFTESLDKINNISKNIKFTLVIYETSLYVTKPLEEDKSFKDEINTTADLFTYSRDRRLAFSGDYTHTDNIDDAIFTRLKKLYDKEFKIFSDFFDHFKEFYSEDIYKIALDAKFYFTYKSFMNKISLNEELVFSIPELSSSFIEESLDSFDLALAHKLNLVHEKIVTNSYKVSDGERIIVITGPNQGGKTTFTRQLGQLHYLASLGVPVQGKYNKIHIVDNIYTFFKTEENLDNLDGKLKTELHATKNILKNATQNSLLLFNEIFASTTKIDGIEIANLVMDEITKLGSFCVFVTFLKELSERKDVVLMTSNVLKENKEIRTFKITRSDDADFSYPSSIQSKYNLTYDKILKRLKNES